MKSITQNLIKKLIVAVVLTAPSVNFAAYIPLRVAVENTDYVRELDVQAMARIANDLMKTTLINTGDYIPLSLPTYSSDADQIANKILRHTVQNWLDDEHINLAFVKQAQKLNDTLSAELPIGKSSSGSASGRADAGGKFKVRFRPVQTEAQIRYEGSFGANLSYNIADATTRVDFSWSF